MGNRTSAWIGPVVAATILGAALFGAAVKLAPLADALRNPFAVRSRTLSGPVLLQQVQRLQRLETSRYQGEVIVEGETKGILPTWVSGDRLLFVGRGEVVAGIDLARLRPADLRAEGERVSIRLPAAEILHTRLDNHQSEVFDRRAGFFGGTDSDLETRVRVEAEDRIREAARTHGLLKTAQANAQEALRTHLNALGFRQVDFL
jgi:hypothetical protein